MPEANSLTIDRVSMIKAPSTIDEMYIVDTEMVYAHSIAALIALLISVIFGIIISLQFILPETTGDSLIFGWGRLRYAHTQGIMLGWLGNAFLAFLYHAVPVLTQRPVTNKRLARWLFGIWNFVIVIPGWILVLGGISQSLEWAEFPLLIDFFVILGFILAAVQFLPPFFRRGLDSLYVSSWYIIGGLVFTILAYPMGNIVPEFVVGATSAAFGGLWIHDAVGLFVTPLALAIIYFVIPAVSGRPIYSHFLSMLGFWGLFFLYPLNGTHHYVFSVIPMAAQMGAIVASALLGIIVVIVVTNLLLSLRGSGFIPRDPALRFVSIAIIFYLIVSVQGSLQAQMSLNQTVHFTDWVIGHSHLAMLGFATFASIGGIIHAWQRISWAKYNATAINWSFWLLTIGISIMVIDLTIAGVVQAKLWQSGAPWLESIQASNPYWFIRSLAALPISAGFISLFFGLCSGVKGAGAQALAIQRQEQLKADLPQMIPVLPTISGKTSQTLHMSYIVASVAGFGCFVFSILLLGVWPGYVLDKQITQMSPPNLVIPTDSEKRGRKIYAREGCAYCHTQQIRYVESDIKRFGAPTLAWETQFDAPHLWGTRRIGPDLSRESSVRTQDWQYAHLFAPRVVVPLSIMPSYQALFEGSADKPTQEARDLVAYLLTLGAARELAGIEGDMAAKIASEDDPWAQMSLNAPQLNAHGAKTQTRGSAPDFSASLKSNNNVNEIKDKGEKLWKENCSGCHGSQGRGNGPAARWLSPSPSNLAEHNYSLAYIRDALWNGIEGTAMPAWRDQSFENLAALTSFVDDFTVKSLTALPNAKVLAQGEQVYTDNCMQCHGENGDGNGFAGNQFSIKPSNFTGKRPSIKQSLKALNQGIESTAMAPWGDRLDENEMLAVTHYLRLFFSSNAPDFSLGESNDH